MEEKLIGVDFKTVTLGMQGDEFLSLVVIATCSQIHVFDVVHSDTVLLESGLKELLESEKIVKVRSMLYFSLYTGKTNYPFFKHNYYYIIILLP